MNPKPLVLFFSLLASLSALAVEPPITVEGAWLRAVPPGSPATAAYMTITNNGSETLSLTGGLSKIAKIVSPMVTVKRTVDGVEVSGMELVEGLEIPAGGKVVLKPGGDHLMFMEMTEQPAPGSTVVVRLQFKPEDPERDFVEIDLELPVSRNEPELRK